MIAFASWESKLHDCGHPRDETMSILADPDNPQGEYFYEAQLPMRCHACTALNKMQETYNKDGGHDPARMWSVMRRERAPRS